MRVNVNVQGMDSILQRFQQLERATRKEVGGEALSKAGDIMIESLKNEAPKGETGNLTSSMGVVSKSMTSIKVGHANSIDRTNVYHYYQNYGNSFTNATNFFSLAYFDVKEECYQIIKETLLQAMGF